MNRFFPALLAILLITGCAVFSDHYKGRSLLDNGSYDEAIVLFEKALKTSPNDPGILTDLGVAFFRKDDLERASGYFEKAKSADPSYSKACLYQGMVYEKQDDIPKAIGEYNEYYQKNPLTLAGQRLKARMGILMRKQIAEEIKLAIEREESLDVDSIPENTIAVAYFANHTGDAEFDVLGKGLADMVITDLSQVNALKVLERTRMQALMDELKLAESGVIDKSTAPRAGRLLGARRIVNGGLALPQADMFRMDALATDVATAGTDAQADAMGAQERFFLMEKELVFDILDNLKVPYTQEERDAIQKLPTESFLAFLAYSRGLDYGDRGMYREAALECQKAAKIDPNFSKAVEKCQENRILADAPTIGSFNEMAGLAEMVEAAEEPVSDDMGLSNDMRQEVIEQNIGSGFLPSPDEGDQADDRTPPQQQTRTNVTVTVELQ